MDKEQTRKLDVIKEHYENLTANTNLTNIHFNVLRDDKHQPNLKLDWSVAQMQAWDKLQRSIDWLTYYFFFWLLLYLIYRWTSDVRFNESLLCGVVVKDSVKRFLGMF